MRLIYLFIVLLLVFPCLSQASTASWYHWEACNVNSDDKCPTASGDSLYTLIEDRVLFAASYKYLLHSKVRVTSPENGKSAVFTILDRGPNRRLNRDIDLCKLGFERIANTNQGLINVAIELL